MSASERAGPEMIRAQIDAGRVAAEGDEVLVAVYELNLGADLEWIRVYRERGMFFCAKLLDAAGAVVDSRHLERQEWSAVLPLVEVALELTDRELEELLRHDARPAA